MASDIETTMIQGFKEHTSKCVWSIRDFERWVNNIPNTQDYTKPVLKSPVMNVGSSTFQAELIQYRTRTTREILISSHYPSDNAPQNHYSFNAKIYDQENLFAAVTEDNLKSTSSNIHLFNWSDLEARSDTVLKDGTLTIHLDFTLFVPTIFTDTDDQADRYQGPELTQLLQFASNDKDLCDFNLKSRTQDFPCHKIFLSMQSDVFRKLFQHNPEQLEADLTSHEAGDVKKLLEFIYTNQLEDSSALNSVSLLYLSDLYNVEGLRKACEKALASRISLDNAFQTLSVAKQIDAPFLLAKSAVFVSENMRSLASVDDPKTLKSLFS